MDEKFAMYNKEHLSEFRKSIKAMGEPIHNGTVEIPIGLTKGYGAKVADKVKIEELMKTPWTETLTWRKYSRIYFAHPLYRRLLEYFAYIYYNQYIVMPIMNDGTKASAKKKLMKDYNEALRTLDEDIKVEDFTSQALLNLLIEGQTFYYIEKYKKGANFYYKAIQLPTDYCKIIGTAGTPAINIFAVDLTFIDSAMSELTKNNILSQEEVLKQYPAGIRAAYKQYKEGKTKGSQWFVVPVENGIAFSTNDGKPPLHS